MTTSLSLEAARRDIVEVGSRMYRFRLVIGLEGNVSARVGDDWVLATPAGVCKGFLQPEDLALADLQGRPVGDARPSTELGMHLAIYAARPDVRAIVHGHPPFATAFATAGRDLDLCLLPEVVVSLGAVPVTRYATPGTAEVGSVVCELIVDHDAILLRNHGVVAVGKDVLDAYYKLETVDHVARITLLSMVLGGPQPLSQQQVDRLQSGRAMYGLSGTPPSCKTAEEAAAERTPPVPAGPGEPHNADVARIIAEEIARALGER
jgi:L-fuculose-phosphate aldolase